ncbi:MAG: hypothetical protein WA705_01685 [Candidatus Ozemobacteraceae bacterium]
MPKTEWQSLLTSLESLLTDPREYCSHSTAMFLLGLLPEPPEKLTIVTPCRRRPRNFEERELVFIHLPPERLEPVQTIERAGCRLIVSTLEKSLIDFLAYLDLAPAIEQIADWFASLPFDSGALLRQARNTSDSVFKRAIWLMACTGRLGHDRIPWPEISATPVRLDPRVGQQETLWDGRFCLKFPSRLLGRAFPMPSPPGPPEVKEWLELCRFPPFLAKIAEWGRFPIRLDPAPRSIKCLDEWAREFLVALPVPALGTLLERHAGVLRNAFPGEESGKEEPGLPFWLNSWLEGRFQPPRRSNTVPCRDAIVRWVEQNLVSKSILKVESAIRLGYILGLGDPVLDSLETHAYKLLEAGGEPTLLFLAEDRLTKGAFLAPKTCVALARTKVRRGSPDQALVLLRQQLEKCHPGDKPATEGELRYAIGGILRRLGHFEEAVEEFTLARACYAEAQDERGQIMVESALGNLYLGKGNPVQAHAHLLGALKLVPKKGEREARALLLTNLAQAEYNRGRFRKSASLLTRAKRVRGRASRGLNAANLLVVRAKARLELGRLAMAMSDLQAASRFPAATADPKFSRSLAALQAWCCQLLGQDAAARARWDAAGTIEESEVRMEFAIRFLKTMATRFSGEFTQAADQYRELLFLGSKLGLSAGEIGGIWLGIGACEALAGLPSAPESLKKAKDGLGLTPERPEARQANILIFALAPQVHGPQGVDLREEVSAVLASGAFDPFWAWYASTLLRSGEPAVDPWLRAHLHRTPVAMRNVLCVQIPGFADLVKAWQRHRKGGQAGHTCLMPNRTQRFSAKDYRQWKKQEPSEALRFDGPTGRLSHGSRKCRLKPGSLLHRILTNLLAAHPRPVRLEQLFASVWGSAFDPEFDHTTVKTALGRLRKVVRSVLPGNVVRLVRSESTWGGLRLELPAYWEAVF